MQLFLKKMIQLFKNKIVMSLFIVPSKQTVTGSNPVALT